MRPFAPRKAGMPAAHAIVATIVAVATVAVGSRVGLLERGGSTADASTFDQFGTTTTVPGTATASTAPVAGTDVSSATPASAAPATAAPVETTRADEGRTPTKSDPLRLYIAGDSDAGNLGPPLQRELEDTGLVKSDLFYKVSSGLSRPDFFDWPSQLTRDIAKYNPDVVVVTFGGNDAQDLLINGQSRPVDSPEWKAEYASRVGKVMDFLSADGRTLVWVGIPNAKSEDTRARMDILQQVTKAEADKRPQIVYVDVWNIFVGRSGGYADYITDPRDGKGKLVRASDGFHLNQTGAEILALTVAEKVKADMRARGAAV